MSRALLFGVRWVLPLAILAAGVALLARGGDSESGAGVAIIGVAVSVWLLNVFIRGSIVSNRDRQREEAAREYFDRHGRWPDED